MQDAPHCIGCGGKLQNTDKTAPFYTPKALDTEETVYCMRCFRMRNYGEVMPTYLSREDYLDMMLSIPKEVLIANVIDVFDIEGSILPQLHKLTQGNRLMVIANKRDLLPKSVKDAKLKHKINTILHAYGLKPEKILLISAEKRWGIDELIETLQADAKKLDIYVVGTANVGKSTIINHMISSVMQKNEAPITTFHGPGTTQDFIKIPFFDTTLYDTPGLIKKNHLYNLLEDTDLKLVQPKKEVKPRSYQLEVNQTIFAGGLLRMDFLKGLPTTFTFYIAPEVTLHRTKMINADQFYEKHVGGILKPPQDPKNAFEFKVHQFPLKRDQKTDIVVPGLGFFSVKGTGVLRIHTPKTIDAYQRESLI